MGRNLYNGNISRSTMAISQFNNVVGYSYRYDQLNRLRKMRTHGLTTGVTTWSAATAGDAYQEDVTYDGNGNILTYLRNGSGVNKGKAMDNLSYGYQRDAAGNLLNNRLLQVKDAVTSTEYADDLRSQNDGNYSYDNIGNLIKDDQAGISKIEWTAYGKIRSITNTKNNTYLDYRYDATGNRIYKGYTHGGVTDKTWYVRDAQGNVLAVYGNKNGDNQIYWKEQQLYGSQRLGVWTPDMVVTSNNAVSLWGMAGKKKYELSNHLGNVIVTVSDYLGGNNKAVVTSAQDYYPFGMMQVDRTFNLGEYRYGFNGQERSDDIKGEGNSYTALFWEYDSRIGRRWNKDPKPVTGLSLYATFANNPIANFDQFGDTTIFNSKGIVTGTNKKADGVVLYNHTEVINGKSRDITERVFLNGGSDDYSQVSSFDVGDQMVRILSPENVNYIINEASFSHVRIPIISHILAGVGGAFGPLDFGQNYLVYNLADRQNDKFGPNEKSAGGTLTDDYSIWDFNGGFFYFNGSKDYHLNYIYNLPDAGNFLFGVAAARMNISHDLVMWGDDRHEMIRNNTPDSDADIRAINAGFFYQQRFLEPQSKGNFLWRSYNTTRPTWFRNN